MPRSRTAIVLAVLVALAVTPVAAHDVAEPPLLIDTDAGLDDLRALAVVLAQPRPQVAGIVTSDGVLGPAEGAFVVEAWVERLGRASVPVVAGRSVEASPPPFRDFVRANLRDAGLPIRDDRRTDGDPVAHVRKWISAQHGAGVRILCLGPLTNLAALVDTDPGIVDSIHSVYWAADPRRDDAGAQWNLERDRAAADAILDLGIDLRLVSPAADGAALFDAALLDDIESESTPAAEAFAALHAVDDLRAHALEQADSVADDLTAIVALQPLVARFESWSDTNPIHARTASLAEWDRDFARAVYRDRFSDDNGPQPRPYVVLERYPIDPEQFLPDVAPLVDPILERHGLEEWRASVLTNELHRHLGIYSIVGVKMGILARELLDADLNELRVTTWAGPKPPVSCLADGLQVSTGASLGRGTIDNVEAGRPEVRARFTKGDRSLELALSDEVLADIRTDVRTAAERYGNLTDAYFDEIRRLSLQYWLDLDRHSIFERTDDRRTR